MEEGKSLIAGQGQPKHLVICFSPYHFGDYPMYYTFESFSISKLIVRPLKRKRSKALPSSGPTDVESPEDKIVLPSSGHADVESPEEEFVLPSSGPTDVESPEDMFLWRDGDTFDDCCPHYLGMGFLHIGGGEVYAVGGMVPEEGNPMLKNYIHYPSQLSKVFRRISLSTPLHKSKVMPMPSMHRGKYFPLIVEIGGLIYVLSGPRDDWSNHSVEMAFEVYNPSDNTWAPLTSPRFMSITMAFYRCGLSCYSHVVIGNKLHVSNINCSATYDTKEDKWDPCNMFSECKLEPPFLDVSHSWLRVGGVIAGPPFPFCEKAIFYRNDIILCARPVCGELGVAAFKIIGDGEKALQMKLCFDDLPEDFVVGYLVDLGDDYFAAVAYEIPRSEWATREEVAIVTFKVVLEIDEVNGGEGLVCQLMKITRLGEGYGLGLCWRIPIYCFTM